MQYASSNDPIYLPSSQDEHFADCFDQKARVKATHEQGINKGFPYWSMIVFTTLVALVNMMIVLHRYLVPLEQGMAAHGYEAVGLELTRKLCH